MWVPSLGQEGPLEEGMATHSSILVWRILMDRGACWATVHRVTKSWIQPKWLGKHATLPSNADLLFSQFFALQFLWGKTLPVLPPSMFSLISHPDHSYISLLHTRLSNPKQWVLWLPPLKVRHCTSSDSSWELCFLPWLALWKYCPSLMILKPSKYYWKKFFLLSPFYSLIRLLS